MEIFNEYNTAYLKRQIESIYTELYQKIHLLNKKVAELESSVYDFNNPPKFKVGDLVEFTPISIKNVVFRGVITRYNGFGYYSLSGTSDKVHDGRITLICSVDDRCKENQASS